MNAHHSRPQPSNANMLHQERLGFLDKLGFSITRAVGTMVTAILFTVLAFISFPAALDSHNTLIIIAWVAQTFLQLVLLPIILVGQNIQAKHTEIVAEEEYKTTQTTYKDLEHLIEVNRKQLQLLEQLQGKK